ncbi:hypothetical protein LTR36_004528 [Oleoguttula mirabilis]|uniref:Uncharacterized protein n=1 Tax=Oleoguttula mirabilis TaxID=1507867 RepID=A0AAV9JFF0_9PEZI|nr:hypothetical protein LTR36_004528 [Oleoguttula mirabilis]
MAIPTTVSVSQSTYPITIYEIYAPMIEIRWQSSALPVNGTSSSPTPTASSATHAAASAGLSTGVKVAIGVVIPMAVLIAVVLGIWFQRSRSRMGAKPGSTAPIPLPESVPELRDNALHEMEEQRTAHEMDSKGLVNSERHELPANEYYHAWK